MFQDGGELEGEGLEVVKVELEKEEEELLVED